MDRSIDLEDCPDRVTLSSNVNVMNLDSEKVEISAKASEVDIHEDDACWQTEMEILNFKLNIRDWEDFGEDKSPGRFEDEEEMFRNWVCRCCSLSVNDTYLKMMNVTTAKKLFHIIGVDVFAEGLCSRLICEKCFELIEKSMKMEGEEIFYSNQQCEEAAENTEKQFGGNEDINNIAESTNISEKEIFYCNDNTEEDEESEQKQLQTNGYVNNDNAGTTLRVDRVESGKTASNIEQNKMTKELSSNKCETCGKFYSRKSTLKLHIARVHNKIKKFICDFCEYSTSRKEHIRRHIKHQHNQIRPFKCPFEGCSKLFKRKYDAKNHHAVHFDVRNFICECGKSFKRRDNLYQHRRRNCIKRNQAKSHATT